MESHGYLQIHFKNWNLVDSFWRSVDLRIYPYPTLLSIQAFRRQIIALRREVPKRQPFHTQIAHSNCTVN